MRRLIKIITGILLAVGLMLTFAACEETPSTADEERKIQESGYGKLAKGQPPKTMDYSPTRKTINFWIETWNEPNKLSYVYLQNADGKIIGYYILKGLPVSYCASLTPTYRFEQIDGDGSSWADEQVPAPAMDGVYYSGNQCGSYYGQDATTGAYIEYTAGLGINVLLYDQPLPNHPNVEPLGPSSVDDVEGER